VIAFDALLAALVVGELLLTPAPARAVLERTLPERVGLSRPFERRLALELAGAGGLSVEVHEEFPAPFAVLAVSHAGARLPPPADDPSGGPDRGRLPREGRLELVRVYRSDLRGPFVFGALRLCVRGPLGLVERQARFEGRQALAVEPSLPNLRSTLELAASERWQDLRVKLLRRFGGEREFESLREYASGDDVRRVDWKAFARRGKPMVRVHEVERGQELFLLVDRGRRMRVAVEGAEHHAWTKLDWALDTALVIAAVALAKGDRVGAAAFDRGLAPFVAPARASGQLARLTKALFHLEPRELESDLGLALTELAARHRRVATVIVLSDVADPFSVHEQRSALVHASRRQRVVFAALDDPEVAAAARGELGSGVSAEGALVDAARELVADRRRALRELASSGARVLDALPAEAAAPVLAAWLSERRR
jgi:uncharacterized protein (DUF58 family)